MIFILLFVILAIIIFAPRLWVSYVLKKYNRRDMSLPGTGGELAQHLAERFNLDIKIIAEMPDSYDPSDKTVRLSPQYFHGRSLTAIAIAAHEVGHAIQDQQNYLPLRARGKTVMIASVIQRIASAVIMLSPLLFLVPGGGVLFRLIILVALIGAVVGLLAHLITLPVEFDASFKRALPILIEGDYINAQQQSIVHKILLAAALTYVAAALSNLLNLAYWFRVFRR